MRLGSATYALDHVFICCSVGAPEARVLARLGLREGTPNTHPGQGTANRRFFFQNAYIELLWGSDADEAQSEPARATRLWERWSLRAQGACPFGVGFRPGPDVEPAEPPFATWPYTPPYLPAGLAIDIAADMPLDEPMLFYVGFARRPPAPQPEPTDHGLALREVTRVTIDLPSSRPLSTAARAAQQTGLLSFRRADHYLIELSFDAETRGQAADLRPDLPLVLRW